MAEKRVGQIRNATERQRIQVFCNLICYFLLTRKLEQCLPYLFRFPFISVNFVFPVLYFFRIFAVFRFRVYNLIKNFSAS